MEGISAEEARDILIVVKSSPRWLMPNGDTVLGFELVKNDGDVAQRICVTHQAPHRGIAIAAAKYDTVKRRGTVAPLFKVVEVRSDMQGNLEYVTEPLQHWQVPRPCDEELLGWSPEYCDVARALAGVSPTHSSSSSSAAASAPLLDAESGDVEMDMKKEIALRKACRCVLSADEVELDTDNVTFNDIKQLVVVPLAHRFQKCCFGPSSLAYTRILGKVGATHSSDGRISSKASDDGKGLHSRRANIFFSWSFAQRFEDFVDAFDQYLVSPDVNIPVQSRQRMYGWVSPLSLDQLAAKQDGPAQWAEKFEVLVRAIGENEHHEPGKGHGTVVVFTSVSPPLCSPESVDSFEPEPLTRLWCVWEMFVTMKTGSRLTVMVPKRYSRPHQIFVNVRAARSRGVEAQLIRRVVEVQATMEVNARLDFADVDDFVTEAFECETGAVRLGMMVGRAALPTFIPDSVQLLEVASTGSLNMA